MTRQSLEVEVAAAKAVAAKAGLGAVDPQVLKLAWHTTLRLAPLPIVARIQSGGSPHAQSDMDRELAIAGALASLAAPTVRPATNVDAGPYLEDGCAISLWDFAVGREADGDVDAPEAARALRQVREALEQVDVELPSFIAAVETCETILSDTAAAPNLAPNDRRFLAEQYARLRDELDRRELDCRPLHGDTHLANVLITRSGPLWMDLEAVCSGPLEWDVVTLPRSAWSEFPGLDPELMALLGQLRSLCVAIWCWADFHRSAETAEAATYHLGRLKARFG